MGMTATMLRMKDTRTLRVFEAEFGFVVLDESFDNGIRIGRVRWRIDMHVVDRARCPTVSRSHDEVVNLLPQRFTH